MKNRILAALFLVFIAAQPLYAGNSLSKAAISGDLESVKEIVKSGEGVNDIDKWGWTALMWSVYYGNIPVAKWFLEKGANPDLKTEKEYGSYLPGTTALILAASYGHHEAVDALLKKKADAKYVDRKGKKAIDYAREYQFDSCVSLLERSK
ncbi:MAG TPA: ankyrin repeat domain-containing protein [Desulfuromonadaceae bacterium]|jgi:ankyrin repeat protein